MSEDSQWLSVLVTGVSQEMAERFLSDLGCKAWKADPHNSKDSAIEALMDQAQYDLIITAYREPLTDELELMLKARSLAHRRDTPIVML